MNVIPYPGFVIVHREKQEEMINNVIGMQRGELESDYATMVHPGNTHWKLGQRLVVKAHCGTDFWWEDGDMEFTILNQNTEVLAEVEDEE